MDYESNRKQIFKMATISTHTVLKCLWRLNYATHQLENLQLPSEETALNFQYWDVSTRKPSPEVLDHNLQSKGFRSRLTEGQSEMEMRSGTFVSCHCRIVCALCAGAESCCKFQFRPWKGVLHEETSLFGRQLQIFQLMGSVIQLMSSHKDLRTVCVLMVAILNNYLRF